MTQLTRNEARKASHEDSKDEEVIATAILNVKTLEFID